MRDAARPAAKSMGEALASGIDALAFPRSVFPPSNIVFRPEKTKMSSEHQAFHDNVVSCRRLNRGTLLKAYRWQSIDGAMVKQSWHGICGFIHIFICIRL